MHIVFPMHICDVIATCSEHSINKYLQQNIVYSTVYSMNLPKHTSQYYYLPRVQAARNSLSPNLIWISCDIFDGVTFALKQTLSTQKSWMCVYYNKTTTIHFMYIYYILYVFVSNKFRIYLAHFKRKRKYIK